MMLSLQFSGFRDDGSGAKHLALVRGSIATLERLFRLESSEKHTLQCA